MTTDKRTPEPDTDSASDVTETELAQDRMGNNQLQGNDQADVHNQRHAAPDAKQETEGVIESFENMDPETRAKCGKA